MKYKIKLENNLLNNIVPFWEKMIDYQFGGAYGECSDDGVINKTAVKGSIYLCRLLWSFSKLYNHYHEEKYLVYATHIFDFIDKYLFDNQHSGIMWSVNYDGSIDNSCKHLYAQSFAAYGLSEYYKITKNHKAYKRCESIRKIIEKNIVDFPNNYHEAYTKDWEIIPNSIMEGYGRIPDITTNTILHLAEGMGNCYVAFKEVGYRQITEILCDILFQKGYDFENENLYQFLNRQFKNEVQVYSYGHNIEVSWLFKRILEDCEIDRPDYLSECSKMANKTIAVAFNGQYLVNEKLNNNVDNSAIWWVQAETLVGLKYYYNDKKIDSLIKYLENNIFTNSEWIWGRDELGAKMTEHSQAEMWKSNYHNVRAILELIGE